MPEHLSFDEHGFVDMDLVPDTDLDPTELAALQADLATVPTDVVDSHGWDELVQAATADDAGSADDSLVPDDAWSHEPTWDSPDDAHHDGGWHGVGEHDPAHVADADSDDDGPGHHDDDANLGHDHDDPHDHDGDGDDDDDGITTGHHDDPFGWAHDDGHGGGHGLDPDDGLDDV